MNRKRKSLAVLLCFAGSLMFSCKKENTPAPVDTSSGDTASIIAPYTKSIAVAHIWRGTRDEHNHLGTNSIDSTFVVQDFASIVMDDDSSLHFENWYTSATLKCTAFSDSDVIYENGTAGIVLQYNYVLHKLHYEQHYAVTDYSTDIIATTQSVDVTANWKYLTANITGSRLWRGVKRYYVGTPPTKDTTVSLPDITEDFTVLANESVTSDLIERRNAVLMAADSALLVFHSYWYDAGTNVYKRDALIYYFPLADSIHAEFGSPLAYQPYYWYDTP